MSCFGLLWTFFSFSSSYENLFRRSFEFSFLGLCIAISLSEHSLNVIDALHIQASALLSTGFRSH